MLEHWTADFYFKVDDDVALSTDALHDYLLPRRSEANLYLVRDARGARAAGAEPADRETRPPARRRTRGRLPHPFPYAQTQGCMKSGQVLRESKYKWFEPEHWRFGDPLGSQGVNYPRHATGGCGAGFVSRERWSPRGGGGGVLMEEG